MTAFLRLNMWQKYIIGSNIKRSVILFDLFQMQLGEWYVVVVLSMTDTELLISIDVRSHFWRRNQLSDRAQYYTWIRDTSATAYSTCYPNHR